MSAGKNILKSLKSGKANVFILFLVLSILYLLLTKFSANYTQTVRFNVQPKQIPEDKLILKDSSHYLDVTLTTYGFKFLRYYIADPDLIVNVGSLEKNDSCFIWTREMGFGQIADQFESNVLIDAIAPDTLLFKYDNAAVKLVPVHLTEAITYQEGFSNTRPLSVVPDSIKIIGPQSIVDTILNLKSEVLKIDNVSKNINENVQLILPDVQNQISFSDSEVQVLIEVEKFTEGSVDVPIIVNNIPEDVRLTFYPKVVSVTYFTSLSNFDNIRAEDFTISCDYNDLDENTTFLIPRIASSPEGLKNLRLDTNKIEFILNQ